MKIRKGGITRNIDKKRFNEYKAKGYEVVEEKPKENSSEYEEQSERFNNSNYIEADNQGFVVCEEETETDKGRIGTPVENAESEVYEDAEDADSLGVGLSVEEAGTNRQEMGTDELEKMTVAELKVFAENNDIDLCGATKKADILKVITGRVW